MLHESAENLYSIASPESNDIVISQILSPSESDMALQFPHHPLNDPLSSEIMNNKPAVNECYSKMQQLVPYTKVDMTSALGVLITYQDNDGD